MKIIKDTLQHNGKYSRKSLTTLATLMVAIGYELVFPLFGYATKEYVFQGLLILCGSTLGLTVWDKKSNQNQEI